MSTPAVILLAEDEETDVFFVSHALKQTGLSHLLVTVTDGKAAVDYLGGQAPYQDRTQHPLPALLLLDLKMPRMDGFGVLQWLKQTPGFAQLPVVVLTSSADEADREKALRLGASEYRIKPAKPKELVRILQQLHDRWLADQPPLFNPKPQAPERAAQPSPAATSGGVSPPVVE